MKCTPLPDLGGTGSGRSASAVVSACGFREYDVRWLFPQDINLLGMRLFGRALGVFYQKRLGVAQPEVVVGHDWRSYSLSVKQALVAGLRGVGCAVRDIGLTLSPIAYFAQKQLGVPCLAMVTASHNENGWTGVKMGYSPPLTLLPEDVQELRTLTTQQVASFKRGGVDFDAQKGPYESVLGVSDRHLQDIVGGQKLTYPFKVVVSCGNGTAGAFAPQVFRQIGAQVVEHHCRLDHTFPHHNPNPEDMRMLGSLAQCVLTEKADIGFAFDGDGDRCGAVGPDGREIFPDKLGVLLARYLLSVKPRQKVVVDVKSTSLFSSDPVLRARGCEVLYWKTGHSYMKHKMRSSGAIAGFERSGHVFLAPPFGHGYDDGLLAAVMVLRMCDAARPRTLLDLYADLAPTWCSPTMSLFCPDEEKYAVVVDLTQSVRAFRKSGGLVLGQEVLEVNEVNGVRITLADGTWGLVRASSNKPSLVVVVESPHSRGRMHAMFTYLNDLLKERGCAGLYDQVPEGIGPVGDTLPASS